MSNMIVALLIITGTTVSSTSWSRHDNDKRLSSLQGLRAVYVVVDYDAPAKQEFGLTKEQLEDEVGLRLKVNGIKVLTEQERRKTKGEPYLYVKVDGNSVAGKSKETKTYFFTIGIGVIQGVKLSRKPGLDTEGCTWSRGYSMIVPGDELRAVTEKVSALTFEFIKAVKDASLGPRASALRGESIDKNCMLMLLTVMSHRSNSLFFCEV